MKLDYKINKETHSVIFCKKNQFKVIPKLLEATKSDKKILIIFDSKIKKKIVNDIYYELKLSGFAVIKIECVSEKLNKNEKLLFNIIDVLIKNNFTKKSILMSLGGGVIGDVSALASSLYLRGMIYTCIPSTMTSIIDSSLGGKTAINYRGVINSVGNYYHPKYIFIIDEILQTIPNREFNSGLAEIIKCGIIGEKKILFYLTKNKEKILKRKTKEIFMLCFLTLKTKIKFFINDIYEKNQRLMLNFGHTFAHAIEMSVDQKFKKDYIRHGEAVGLGMLCEVYYERKKKNYLYKIIENHLKNFNLPTVLNLNKIPLSKIQLINLIYKNIFLDKKKINNNPRYVSLTKPQKPRIRELTNYNFLTDTIEHIIN